jgi:hypothetical protein
MSIKATIADAMSVRTPTSANAARIRPATTIAANVPSLSLSLIVTARPAVSASGICSASFARGIKEKRDEAYSYADHKPPDCRRGVLDSSPRAEPDLDAVASTAFNHDNSRAADANGTAGEYSGCDSTSESAGRRAVCTRGYGSPGDSSVRHNAGDRRRDETRDASRRDVTRPDGDDAAAGTGQRSATTANDCACTIDDASVRIVSCLSTIDSCECWSASGDPAAVCAGRGAWSDDDATCYRRGNAPACGTAEFSGCSRDDSAGDFASSGDSKSMTEERSASRDEHLQALGSTAVAGRTRGRADRERRRA